MKTKVVKLSALAAITAVLGMGGLTLNNVSAVTKTTNVKSGATTKTIDEGSGSSQKVTPTPTPTPSTTTPSTTTPTATPNTGIFTGDGEFTKQDGIILLTGGLAAVLAGYALYRNRKMIFRGRVKFDRQ